MTEYTPTWDKVREHYYLGRQQFDDPMYPAGSVTEIVAEFDQWHAAEIAAAEQRGAARGKVEGLREAADEAGSWGPACINAAHQLGLKEVPVEYAKEGNDD